MLCVTSTGPVLVRPCPPLAKYIDYFGYWERGGSLAHRSRALPRGAATVIIDVSSLQRVDFFAADALSRLDVSPAFVAGAGTISYVTQINPAQAVMTIHFRPGGAVPFLTTPQGGLENSCVDLTEIWGSDATALRERLVTALSWPTRIALLQDYLLGRMRGRNAAVTAALATIESRPSMRVADIGAMVGLSPKRLIALFRAEVGISPKAYLRVRRFQAALNRLDSGAGRGAAVAADLGYFDQAHLVREFRSFTAMTPTQYAQHPTLLPNHVGLTH